MKRQSQEHSGVRNLCAKEPLCYDGCYDSGACPHGYGLLRILGFSCVICVTDESSLFLISNSYYKGHISFYKRCSCAT